jgi:hypothetical protein
VCKDLGINEKEWVTRNHMLLAKKNQVTCVIDALRYITNLEGLSLTSETGSKLTWCLAEIKRICWFGVGNSICEECKPGTELARNVTVKVTVTERVCTCWHGSLAKSNG